jgi:hypothetical protein
MVEPPLRAYRIQNPLIVPESGCRTEENRGVLPLQPALKKNMSADDQDKFLRRARGFVNRSIAIEVDMHKSPTCPNFIPELQQARLSKGVLSFY